MKSLSNSRGIRLAAVAAFGFMAFGSAQAGDAPPAPVKGASVEGITEYTLGNGLQVLLFPDPSKPTVTVNVTYCVGSRHEGRGEAGMAHLLEHMVFKGTPTYPNIWGALEDHGASFNGSTWVDRTNYFETLPVSDENLEFALRMEADRMVNSTISGEELAKEMTVVRNEFEMGENDPSGVLSERMMSAAYLWHNYGKSTIGNRSDIERVPVETLRRFYRKYYQPDNATLLVAGRFETESTLDLINKTFGTIPRPERTLENTYTEEPAQDGPRLVTLKRVGDVAVAGLIYHVPAGPHPEFPAVQILEGILTDQPSGLLYKALVETGMATRVSGSVFAWAEPGVLEISAQVAENKDPHEVLDKMIEVVERAASDQITEEAVERIMAQALKAIKLGMTNSARIGVRMSESIAQGDWRMFFIHRDRLKEVGVAEVQQVARKYLAEANRTAGIFVPTEEATRVAVAATPDVRTLVQGYQGSESVAAGEVFTPTPEYVEERTVRRTLASGIKLALLPMEMRGNAVQAGFRLHFGREEDLTGHETALRLIPEMLMRGTTQRDHQALRDEIDRLESRIFVGAGGGGRGRRGGGGGEAGPGMVGASIESDRAHIVPSIELLGEILRQPAFAEAEFRVVVDQERAQLEDRLSDPMARGMTAMSRAMNPWPPESIHYVPTLEEQIARLESVSLGAVKDLYSKHYGAGHLEVAVVGDFDQQEVEAAIERVFGSWKSPSPYQRVAKPHRDVESADLAINTPDKEMAIVGMGANVAMRDDDPDYPALVMASYVLGESAKARLMTRIRHEEGLSYGARGYFRSDDQDQRASLMATAICAPQNAAKALQVMREEIMRWIADGITEEELAESKSSYSLKFESRLATERFLVGELLRGFQIGRTLAWHADLLSKIQALSTADVKNALEKRFAKVAFVAVKAGDLEAKAEPNTVSAPSAEPVGALPERMQQFDKNGDGKLQESEAPERMRPFFARLDANGDGALDAAEAGALRGEPDGSGSGGGDRWQRLLRFDENDNGKIERNEAPERLLGRFDQLDKNRDNTLEESELQREDE